MSPVSLSNGSVAENMKIVKQSLCLSIDNYDDITEISGKKESKHGMLLPETIRAIISGPSGCGKTNVMLSLIFHPNGLRFENIYVYSKSLHQPKYQLLEYVLRSCKGMQYLPYSESDEVIDPKQAKPNSLFLFDDVIMDRQQKMCSFFSMGRHQGVDSFYLCQSYAKVSKLLIRDNANLIILFRQDELNLKHVYDDHVTTDMTFEEFKEICKKCWEPKFGIMVLVKDCGKDKGRYRCGFDQFIIP